LYAPIAATGLWSTCRDVDHIVCTSASNIKGLSLDLSWVT
jgi:hypothetical protein